MGMGPLLLGYRHPAVCQAMREAAELGPVYSLVHPSLVEFAKELLRVRHRCFMNA